MVQIQIMSSAGGIKMSDLIIAKGKGNLSSNQLETIKNRMEEGIYKGLIVHDDNLNIEVYRTLESTCMKLEVSQ